MYRLIGKRVALMISDPWEFGTECGVGPFYGQVSDSGTETISNVEVQRVLVALERPLNYSGAIYVSAMCHVRHAGNSFNDLQAGSHVSVNVTLLPKATQKFSEISDDDFRKGFAATGSLQLA